jgi:exosortase E/protease (VPEID-CTERM system)
VLNTSSHDALTGNELSQSRQIFTLLRHLLGRLYFLSCVLTLDCVALASVPHIGSLLGPFAPAGIVAFAVFLGLGHSTLKGSKKELRFNWWLFCTHLVCIAAVILCYLAVLHGSKVFASHLVQVMLTAIVLAAIALLALACVPLSEWIRTVGTTTSLWVAALLAGVAAGILRHPFQSLWMSSSFSVGTVLQSTTFDFVQVVLRHLLPHLVAEPARFVLGTPRFLVYIAPECSGMEGLGLVLVFTLVWLWYFRKESRFPHALLLIPCALLSVWLLNVVRIAAIILIGNAGAPDVAMVGFHSQAGWIAFTTVALVFSMATRKISWVQRVPAHVNGVVDESPDMAERGESPATAAYLVPFLAILAASFVSRAASGSFEWLYPLRFFAAAIAIWYFRNEYRRIDFHFGWTAPITGVGAFLIWIAPSLWPREIAANSVSAGLAALSPAMRSAWIAIHIAAAVTTIPIAEELAFRGYLARRLISRGFDAVPFSSLTWLSICISSVAFGLLQGTHWFSGIIAGAAYAWSLKRRGRFGEVIAAHATTNLLLAVWVLLSSDWALW